MSHSPAPRRRIPAPRPADGFMLLLEAARDLRTVGAVAPSGKALARALTEPVRAQAGQPLDILEAGAGTGAVTRTLIPQLAPGSRLDVAEANPRFAHRLSELVRAHPHLAGRPPEQVRVHDVHVERLETGRRYDVIVSGLPFTNFSPHHVEAIMDRYLELLRPGGTLTYFAYRGTGRARALLASPAQAHRHRAVERLLAAYRDRCATGRRTAWANLPPATVWQLRRPAYAVEHSGTRAATAEGAGGAGGVPGPAGVPRTGL
ncbi:class I SAM-dependent methyltransferase [Streptomyces marispadix]|uniref:Methyltransferase domain-containing protein n=1 Tax=Streptomyces marispadix TaxID=2922868 RepID=A0ABS9SXN4_9ACTN|nr:methyltransferase [Streptomyces marispadix]MCH6161034.1 methyltransferase domain-containing protein [Streptomyces marispadix]